jgi:hypothetical protein
LGEKNATEMNFAMGFYFFGPTGFAKIDARLINVKARQVNISLKTF